MPARIEAIEQALVGLHEDLSTAPNEQSASVDRVEAPVEEASAEDLWILGHARSGTTAAAYWLNTSANVLVTFEANWDTESRWTRCRSRYNHRHRTNGYAPVKGQYLPPEAGESLAEIQRWAGARFAYVGDKVALRTVADSHWGGTARAVRDRWLGSTDPRRAVLTLRDPDDMLASNLRMFGDDSPGSAGSYVDSIAAVVWLQLCVFFGSRSTVFLLQGQEHEAVADSVARALNLDDFAPSHSSLMLTNGESQPTPSRSG